MATPNASASFTHSPLQRLAPADTPHPLPRRGHIDALARRWRVPAVRLVVLAVVVAVAVAGIVVYDPRVTVRRGDLSVSYDPGWLTKRDGQHLVDAYGRGLRRVEGLTGVQHRGRVTVDAERDPGRDTGGAGWVRVHFVGLGPGTVAGYRNPAHELTHVVAASVNAAPSPLLREGVAVYVDWRLNGGGDLDEVPATVDLADLERSPVFGTGALHRDTTYHYEVAGAVVRYLVESLGWKKFWDLYRAGPTLTMALRHGLDITPGELACEARAYLTHEAGAAGDISNPATVRRQCSID